MSKPINIEDRKPIWIALSEFYLDRELQDFELRHIAFTILDSPFNLDEAKRIEKYELFPVLYPNLLSVVGEWAGFNEEWLIQTITERIEKSTKLSKILTDLKYSVIIGSDPFYWERTEKIYYEIRNQPDGYWVNCRNSCIESLNPFDFHRAQCETYRKLDSLANGFKKENKLRDFTVFLIEAQYYSDLWTAFFILEKFQLNKSEKLNGSDNNELVLERCLKIVENHGKCYDLETKTNNYKNWLKEIKMRNNIE